MIKKSDAIIYVDSNRLLFYAKGFANTLQLSLSSAVIEDLEIVNREKFEHFIDNFFLSPSLKGKEFNATIIFSAKTTFEKELTSNNSKAEFEETQRFLDMVPFEDILSNSYKVNKKTRIVAANKIFYNILRQTLEKNKVTVSLVLPMTILSAVNPELAAKIDLPLIESKITTFTQYSLIDLVEMGLGGEVTNAIGIKRKDVRVYILILVMIGLFIVLIVMFYTTFMVTPPKPKINNTIVPKIEVFPTITPTSDSIIATSSAKNSSPSSSLNN